MAIEQHKATARMAGNLGFNAIVVSDATASFARHDFSGVLCTAKEVHSIPLAHLQDEYAAIVTASDILAALENS